jgi:carboxypeptidase Taq
MSLPDDAAPEATPDTATAALQELQDLDREARLLEHTAAVLSWDQETGMPERAVEERSRQLALLQSLVHQRDTAPRVGELLERLKPIPTPAKETSTATGSREAAFLREKRRRYEKSTRLPDRLVRELAETASRGQNAWVHARRDNDFSAFRPWLEKLIDLNRETAEHLGYEGTRYDALLDQYEPYATTAEVTRVFQELREGLVPLVQRIAAAEQVDNAFLRRSYPVDKQFEFSDRLMTSLGYDRDRGRLDRSAHPFTTRLGNDDVRITTRFDEHAPESGIFSTIHETGHALYELGTGDDLAGTLLAEGTSLGIHESQSRLWENMIGRSRQFWTARLPALRELFPEQLRDVDLDHFYRGINRVEPSLIRVEADEVTYSLHVILRFELEQALISGDLPVADLPQAWREKMKALLGIEPDTDARGVLQDVHWSMGAFGYFPTYALGNLYAAQFLQVLEREIPDMWDQVSAGNTASVLSWLRERIHRHGKARSAAELVREITGGPMTPGAFLDYLNRKYEAIYRG